jgi:putative ABC transport system permease protein
VLAILAQLYPDFRFVPPVWAVAGAVVLATGCGMLFGILPARRAAQLDPVAALARR